MAAACAGRMARVSTQSLAVRLLPPQDAAPSLCRTLLAAAGRLAELPALSAIASVSVPVRQQLARAHIYALYHSSSPRLVHRLIAHPPYRVYRMCVCVVSL
jgi:hypothetical protein